MRTIEEIQQEIIDAKESTPALAALTSNSKVAIWRLWAYVTAVAIYVHETYWDIFLKEVQELIYNAPTGTARWYRNQVLAFQFGDELEWLDNRYRYEIIDDEKKIVAQCAVKDGANGVVVIKAVKDNNGTLIKLTEDELQALRSYVAKIKFAGTRCYVQSLDADQIDIKFKIHYDPIIPLLQVRENVQNTIDAFLSNLPFNGVFNVTKFTDAIQLAEGVKDPVYISGTVLADGEYSSDIDREFVPASGHIELADDIINLFTWIPKID